jgi:receptor protein-tyrosine kinase
LAIRYTERLAAAGAAPSVGTVGDALDDALAESQIGLFKTELIRRRGRASCGMVAAGRRARAGRGCGAGRQLPHRAEVQEPHRTLRLDDGLDVLGGRPPGGQFSQQRVASYARLLTGEKLVGRVTDQLHLTRTPAELAGSITVQAVPETVLLDVTVTDASPQMVLDIAGAIGDQFGKLVAVLETPDGALASPVRVTVVSGPELPTSPSAPNSLLNTAVGLLIGLLVGAGRAVARAKLDRSVRDPEEVITLGRPPVIGMVMRDGSLAKTHVLDRACSSRAIEDLRQLRTNLQFLSVDDPPKVILVSSALPSEGKTTLAINLAVAMAEVGQWVALVEADLRRPRVIRYLGLVSGAGLANVLAGTADFDDVVQTYGKPGMSVLAAGPTPPNPGELLASAHMAALLDKLRGSHDFVFIDAPPLLPVADASGLALPIRRRVRSCRAFGRATGVLTVSMAGSAR